MVSGHVNSCFNDLDLSQLRLKQCIFYYSSFFQIAGSALRFFDLYDLSNVNFSYVIYLRLVHIWKTIATFSLKASRNSFSPDPVFYIKILWWQLTTKLCDQIVHAKTVKCNVWKRHFAKKILSDAYLWVILTSSAKRVQLRSESFFTTVLQSARLSLSWGKKSN